MVDLISRSREDNSFILKQEFQKIQNLLESAIILFSQQEDLLKEELFNHIKCYMSQKFYNPERPFKTLVEEAEHVLYFFNNYIMSTIYNIQMEFGNFALQIWCPTFVQVLTEIIWPSIESLAHDGKDESMNFHELTFKIYIKLKNILKYGESFENTYDIFKQCLPCWSKCASTKAKEQVQKTLELLKSDQEKLKSGQINDLCSYNDPEMTEIWLQCANNFDGIFQTCHETWLQLEWPDLNINLEFGLELYTLLNKVHKDYIKGIHDIILINGFDHKKLVLVLTNLHKSSHYVNCFDISCQNILNQMKKHGIDDPEKNEISIDLSKKAHENIQLEVTYLIELFCKNQKTKFLDMSKAGKFCQGEPEDEETDHLLGYLNSVLKFLHNNLDLEQEDLNLKYQAIIKERLFDILEDEMIKNVANKNIQVSQLYEALEQTIDFRRNVSLVDSSRLNEAKHQMWLKNLSYSELIVLFFNQLELSKENHRGYLKFSVLRKQCDVIVVSLKSVSKLIPRQKPNFMDFSLSLSMQPADGNEFTEDLRTEIIKNRIDHFFDISENNQNNEQDVFTFKQCKQEYFLQVILYEHSLAFKRFRGIYIFPLNQIPEEEEELVVSGQFWSFPTITNNHSNWNILEELKSRTSLVHKNIASEFIRKIQSYTFETRCLQAVSLLNKHK